LIPVVLDHFVQVKLLDCKEPGIDFDDLSWVSGPLHRHHVGWLVINPVFIIQLILFVFLPVLAKVVPDRGVTAVPLTSKLLFFILLLLTIGFFGASIGVNLFYFCYRSFGEIVRKQLRIKSGRHKEQLKLETFTFRSRQQMLYHHQTEIDVQVPLMHFIHDQVSVFLQ